MPKKKPHVLVRLEPDVNAEIRRRIKTNGRTVQGEVNCVIRESYKNETIKVPAR